MIKWLALFPHAYPKSWDLPTSYCVPALCIIGVPPSTSRQVPCWLCMHNIIVPLFRATGIKLKRISVVFPGGRAVNAGQAGCARWGWEGAVLECCDLQPDLSNQPGCFLTICGFIFLAIWIVRPWAKWFIHSINSWCYKIHFAVCLCNRINIASVSSVSHTTEIRLEPHRLMQCYMYEVAKCILKCLSGSKWLLRSWDPTLMVSGIWYPCPFNRMNLSVAAE